MTRILAVSPHLDDAVFSAGGTLARHAMAGDDVTVLTCFTGNVEQPTGFALACQLDKGLAPDVDYMALRREEDLAACRVLNAREVHLPFLEAPHRGYDSAAALFEGARVDDEILEPLIAAIQQTVREMSPDIVYGPIGVGGHVDHILVRNALERVVSDVILWEDFPYSMRDTGPREPGLRDTGQLQDLDRRVIGTEALEAKYRAASCYTTQIGFQFGSLDRLREIIDAQPTEAFLRPPP